MKILIADDDRTSLRVLEAALSKWEYNVVSVGDGKEAWEAIQQDADIRLAVLDWDMPHLDGIELCRKIKGRENAPFLFIMLLTSKSKKEDIVMGLDSGADDFISKPFNANELKSRLAVGNRILQYEEEIEKNRITRESQQKLLIQADKMASIGIMAAGVAHEINNPLNVAIGDIHLLKKDFKDIISFINLSSKSPLLPKEIERLKRNMDLPYIIENVDNKLSRCEGAMERVKHIVEQLRKFSHLDTGKKTLIDLNKSIENTLTMIPKAFKQDIEIKKEFGLLSPVSCFGREINQVFLNIIVNAFQAMKGGGILKIETSSDEKYVYVKFCDTGSGIPEDKIKQIFNPFFTTKPVGEGTGLGLSISYSIIEGHRGDITASNNVDKGATFTVKFLKKSA